MNPQVADPRFSVIIPAYQSSSTIAAAVASALEQTHPPHEVIVIDDGSTDHPERVIEQHRDHIVFLQQANAGPGSARNAGLRAATGDWAVLLDADDRWYPGRLEAIAAQMDATPDAEIITTDAVVVDPAGVVLRRWYDETTFRVDDQRTGILGGDFVFVGAAFPVERALGLGGFDERLIGVEDWELWIRMILGGSRAVLVEDALAEYVIHDRNLSQQTLRMWAGRRAVYDELSARSDLTVEEARLVRVQRRRAAGIVHAMGVHRALTARDAGARRLAWAAVADSQAPPAIRLKAGVAAISPGVARRFSSDAERLTGRERSRDELQ